MRKPTKQTCVVLLLIVVLFMSVMGQGDASSATDFQKVSDVMDALDEYQQFLTMLVQLRESLGQVVLAAYEGLQAYAPEDQIRNAQVIVNLLEGPQSPLYDPSIELADSPVPGIRPWVEDFLSESTERSSWDEAGLSYEDERGTTVMLPPNMFQLLRDWLRLASVSAVAATDPASPGLERRDDLLIAQAFLVILSNFTTELTRPLRVTVVPGESIQSAIDRAWSGGTVFIDPGVYRETLYIRKDITLQGFGSGVVLEPIDTQTGILIRSDEQAHVEINNLTIRNAGAGLSVEGNVTLQLNLVELESCATGLRLEGDAHAIAEGVRWIGNGMALLADGTSDALLLDATIEDSTSSLGGIVVQGNATVALENATVMDGMGNGILLLENATATVEDSLLRGNALDGIRVTDASHLLLTGNDFYYNGGFGLRVLSDQCSQDGDPSSEAFSGSVSGSGNRFGSSNSVVGNALGQYCPEDLTFLTEPKPAEVSVELGQSIQAAIDMVADGGVVVIEPGSYAEAITINKSLSLIRAVDESGDVILNGNVDGPALSVIAHTPIDVTLSGLVFQGEDAGWAIDVGENATVEMQNLVFHDLGTAIRVRDGGSVTASHCDFTGNGSTVAAFPNGSFTASWCMFSDNRQAVLASWSSVCTLTDSTIRGCTGDGAAISVSCTDLEIRSCTIRDSVGSAIQLGGGEATKLHIINSSLTGNAYGIDFTYGSCNPGDDPDWEGASASARSYATVTGWNNDIPGSDEPDGNREGAFWYCFPDRLGDPSFLTEPKPAEE